MTNFEVIFEELAKTNDCSVIWNNWLEFVIQCNLMNHPQQETNFHNNEKEYVDLMNAWLNELTKSLETKSYYDILGEFYEVLVQSRSKSKSLGQLYTPPSVTDLLSRMVIPELDGFVNDPTCGSGRTLLAAHVKSKGELICIGQDLDLTSCQMCVLNMWSHGVRGSVLHMDTLEGKFFQGWRVNNYLYHGLPVPHIELVSESEAYNFIGVSNEVKPVELTEPVKTESVQSKLM